MKDWKMFSEIQALKNKGFKKMKVCEKLNINYRTAQKYWDMTPEDYEKARKELSNNRYRRPDKYRNEMILWLKEHPDISSAQVHDWLVEKYGDSIDFSERTTRKYVKKLREEEGICKTIRQRQYEAVEDPPFGYQAQVDIGRMWLKDEIGKRVLLYFFAIVLSNSRCKFVRWQIKPFTADSFIEAHELAFEFYGGHPKEIVYDQDRVMVVSENNGDIIHTERFQSYLSVRRFKVYLCRGNDPETKGRIEAVIKYVKNNFARGRIFIDEDSINDDCLKWLERRGNGRRHEITQKIPAEVFALEREHLIPINSKYESTAPINSVTYQVRKDNTVLFRSNRYCVPKGTYRPGLQVQLTIANTSLIITDAESGIIYARHTLSLRKGELIKLRYKRELNKTLTELTMLVESYFEGSDSFDLFINKIRKDKPRYVRDQLGVIRHICEHPQLSVYKLTALKYCIQNNLYSASDLRAAAEYFCELRKEPKQVALKPALSRAYPFTNPKVRDINEYKQAMEGKRWEV